MVETIFQILIAAIIGGILFLIIECIINNKKKF